MTEKRRCSYRLPGWLLRPFSGARVARGEVPTPIFATMFRMYRADGSCYSDEEADLVAFSSDSTIASLPAIDLEGERFSLGPVNPAVDVASVPISVNHDGRACRPWAGVALAIFASPVRPASLRGLLAGCSHLREVLHIERLDVSLATDLSFMFCDCSSLTSLDVSGFDTSRAGSLKSMFAHCPSLTALDVSGFDTSQATDLSFMFCDCSSLTSLDVSGFDTSRAGSLKSMFAHCPSLTALDVSGFDTSQATDLSFMFYDCSSLTSLDVSGFDTSRAGSLNGMFCHCSSLTSLDVSGFDTSSATNMRMMFHGCSSLTSLDVSAFDTSRVDVMAGMFQGCSSLVSLDVSGFDTSRAKHFECMFDGCRSLTYLDVSKFEMLWKARDDDLSAMFAGCTARPEMSCSLHAGASTDKGGRAQNEDSFCFADDVLVVSDGIGGAPYGEVLSKICCRWFLDCWSELRIAASFNPEGMMNMAFESTDDFASRVSEYLEEGSGATMVAAAAVGDLLVVGGVGDSAAFIVKNDGSVVRALRGDGRAAERGNALDGAMGYGQVVQNPRSVRVAVIPMREVACVCLCSDGVWGQLDGEAFSEVLVAGGEPYPMAYRLVKTAVDAYGSMSDNATAVVAVPTPAKGLAEKDLDRTPLIL